MTKESSSESKIRLLLQDAGAAIILLLASFAVDRIKILFGPGGVPFLTSAILNLSEATLFISFLVSFVRALVRLMTELDKLLIVVRKLGFVKGIFSLLRMVIPSLRSLSEAFRIGLISSTLVGLTLLIVLAVARLPAAMLLPIFFVLAAYLILATYQQRSRIAEKGLGFLTGAAIIALLMILLSIVVKGVGGPSHLVTIIFNR